MRWIRGSDIVISENGLRNLCGIAAVVIMSMMLYIATLHERCDKLKAEAAKFEAALEVFRPTANLEQTDKVL